MGANVVGLDLSITATGVAYAHGGTDVWKLPAKLRDERLSTIAGCVKIAVQDFGPVDLVVIEDLPTHAHGAGITGMVHGAVRCELLRAGVPYVLVTPATLKKYATGKGNADKTAMTLALYKRTGLELADDNQVDAWWLRAAGLQHLGFPVVELPAAQVDALSKVEWPAACGTEEEA